MTMNISPNLAPSERPNLDTIPYPVYASVKFDGVRAVIMDGIAYSRKGLPLHEVFHKRFAPFLEKTKHTNHVFDVEVFNPEASFTQITSSLANEDGCELKLYVFDYLKKEEWEGKSVTPFARRIENAKIYLSALDPQQEYTVLVKQVLCTTKEEIITWFEEVLADGGEGLMLRDPKQLYKHGRSTAKATPEKGGGFWKLKAMDTLDAVIIGFEPMNRLTEEAKATITDKDAFGRSKRGHRKGDRETVDEIGKVILQIPDRTYIDDKGKEQPFIFKATWTKNSPVRTEMTWANREQHIGRWCEVEYQECGMKNLPRLPRIKRWRDDLGDK